MSDNDDVRALSKLPVAWGVDTLDRHEGMTLSHKEWRKGVSGSGRVNAPIFSMQEIKFPLV